MLYVDPTRYAAFRRMDLLEEARRERLARQLPRARSRLRCASARVLQRLADWLDDSSRYVRAAEPGLSDWAAPRASV